MNRKKKFLNAVDVVCGECRYLNENNCKTCFVRKMVDDING